MQGSERMLLGLERWRKGTENVPVSTYIKKTEVK